MGTVRTKPGPAAEQAFRLGMRAGVVAGLIVVGVLYWIGALTPATAAYTLLFLFPIYAVVLASVLSVWLGYDKDATALRPVYRSKEETRFDERR